MNDPGDEHVDVPPPPKDPITLMLEEDIESGGLEVITNPMVWWMLCYHEAMSHCCAACALEANGEDGA